MKWFLVLIFCLASSAKAAVPELKIHVAFGYKDARPARFVGDRYEKLLLAQKLQQACGSGETHACGFTRDPEDANIFHKTLSFENKPPLTVELRMTASSAGADDEQNRINPYQRYLSKISRNNFFFGLSNADAIFYVGHSRDGGGPDFAPPLMLKNFHVAYGWYKKHQPGWKHLAKALRMPLVLKKKKNLEVGLMSCASTKLFEKKIRQVNPHVRVITEPDLLYYSDALDKVLGEISKVIEHHASH